VNANPEAFVAHLNEIRGRIAAAAARAGRDPAAITLVGVVKTVPIERLRLAIGAGLADMGQNRVQEAEAACSALGRRVARWHMIGHLQGNKVARALDLFDRIHSVDSIDLAESLSRRAAQRGMRIPVLIQVNVSGEASKHGVSPAELTAVVGRAASLPGLAVDGLMSIGAVAAPPEQARREFARTRELREQTERVAGVRLPELSMGMSGDYEVAVEEGSTLVRVGSALFGARAQRG